MLMSTFSILHADKEVSPGPDPRDAGSSTRAATSSDLARQLWLQRLAGLSMSSVKLSTSLPLKVEERLSALAMAFDELPGLLQRAVLWDSGYAFFEDNDGLVQLIEVHTRCGLGMADLLVPSAFVEAANCSVSGKSAKATATCSAQAIPQISVCSLAVASTIVTTVKDTLDEITWAGGNLSTGIDVHLTLMEHPNPGSDPFFTIRTASALPLVVPCVSYDDPSINTEWCRPRPSALVSAWLTKQQAQNVALLNLLFVASAVLLALALDLFGDRKPRWLRTNTVAPRGSNSSLNHSRATTGILSHAANTSIAPSTAYE
ncbi:TPA: hypothetical protein N0F65_001467 [Lagenidium giganteum]|uniref:Transmembrane protein n=1 Tax=Lagenidium giganteum TaxID=4803 RepID=A0AAV2YIV4_9STRA|nr:TPA: hypothetical protein N0F65_001467 [Lagenidium giganteum]